MASDVFPATQTGHPDEGRSEGTAGEYLEFLLALFALGGALTLGPLFAILVLSLLVRIFGFVIAGF